MAEFQCVTKQLASLLANKTATRLRSFSPAVSLSSTGYKPSSSHLRQVTDSELPSKRFRLDLKTDRNYSANPQKPGTRSRFPPEDQVMSPVSAKFTIFMRL